MSAMGKKEKAVKEKPLEKMTATELRDVAKDIPDITGAHGMNKTELVAAIKTSRGIVEEKKRRGGDVRAIKKQMKAAKAQYQGALEKDDDKMAAIYRKRMLRLKKKTRRVA
jgi:hypothetical protein